MAGPVLRAAVVGGSTLLGRELLNEIGNSAAAAWDLRLLEEGEESEGQLSAAGDEALVVHSLDVESFSGLDVVFFAATPELTKQFLQPAVKAGAAVVDFSGATAGAPGFVMRSPWVAASQRPDLMTTGVCVPHPAALMLAMAGDRLQRGFGKTGLSATVLEPASQAGTAGVDELHQQTVSLLSFQEMPKTVFDTQVAFNLQGVLGSEARVDLGAAKTRILHDAHALLGANSSVHLDLQLLQAPVFHGYVLSAHVHCERPFTVEQVRAALAGSPVEESPDLVPSNKSAIEAGGVLVSVTAAESHGSTCWLLLAADNLGLMVRSGVSAALELVALRPAARVQ